MDLILIRHAEAYERDNGRWPDDRERPLTPRGVKRFRRMARALAAVLPEKTVVWSSALQRAWQTAVILASEANVAAPAACRPLEPGGSPAAIVRRVNSQPDAPGIVLVGHEPELGHIAAHYLLGRAGRSANGLIGFKKGGAACIRFEAAAKPGGGALLWLVTPRLLLDGSG